ncbi:MAG: hypothetical protein EBY81_08330, partial [Verrucomicrobia bacterium]|nr:hypothetical protein [Verrucomicrobiota bacterium]
AQQRLRQRVRPFLLRRTKAEVAKDLPAKIEQIAYCELTDEQKGVYRQILEEGRKQVSELSGKASGGRDRIAVLTVLMRLRQACCHLGLLPSAGTGAKVWSEPSGKMEYFLDRLDEWGDGGSSGRGGSIPAKSGYSSFLDQSESRGNGLKSYGGRYGDPFRSVVESGGGGSSDGAGSSYRAE